MRSIHVYLECGKSDLMQLDVRKLVENCCDDLHQVLEKRIHNQIAISLLTTCSQLIIIKPEQAM